LSSSLDRVPPSVGVVSDACSEVNPTQPRNDTTTTTHVSLCDRATSRRHVFCGAVCYSAEQGVHSN
jgi:hypothetical protein